MELKGKMEVMNAGEILSTIKEGEMTGVLETESAGEKMKLSFFKGRLVYGETEEEKDLNRLRDTFLANGIITREEWFSFHSRYKSSLEFLWNLLGKTVSLETARRLLHRQIRDVFYAFLRQRDGDYRFTPAKNIEYPEHLLSPIETESLMEEGGKIADELKKLEGILPGRGALFQKSQPADEDDTLEVNRNEEKLLHVLDEPMTSANLLDRADLSHFEACSALVSLMEKRVVTILNTEEAGKQVSEVEGRKTSAVSHAIIVFLAFLLVVIGGMRILNMPLRLAEQKSIFYTFISNYVEQRMEKALYPLQAWYLETGSSPERLDEVIGAGLATSRQMTDTWGRQYMYSLLGDHFTLYSMGPDENHTGDDIQLPYSFSKR